MSKLSFRSIWISDVHLGTRACKAEYLLDFLKHTDSQFLYLVGDIIDHWSMRNGWYWPQSHNNVIQKILRKARKGTKVTYVPGNHDELFRDFVGFHFGDVAVEQEVIHETADGRRFLVLHGDEFDGVVKHNKWLAHIGSWAYDVLLALNRYLHWARRRFGAPYWSLSAYLKHKVKNAVNYIGNFEAAVAHEASRHQVDGMICGHIHKAAIEQIGGLLYCNDGDWVESCTALVEHHDGSLAIIHWADESVFLLEESSNASIDCDGRVAPAN
jgi:UDP-2,3-diacylglucosamine pyrophosphatase LpxH